MTCSVILASAYLTLSFSFQLFVSTHFPLTTLSNQLYLFGHQWIRETPSFWAPSSFHTTVYFCVSVKLPSTIWWWPYPHHHGMDLGNVNDGLNVSDCDGNAGGSLWAPPLSHPQNMERGHQVHSLPLLEVGTFRWCRWWLAANYKLETCWPALVPPYWSWPWGLALQVWPIVPAAGRMEAILEAVILDQVQLREDASTAGHYSSGMNQLVQVELPGE